MAVLWVMSAVGLLVVAPLVVALASYVIRPALEVAAAEPEGTRPLLQHQHPAVHDAVLDLLNGLEAKQASGLANVA